MSNNSANLPKEIIITKNADGTKTTHEIWDYHKHLENEGRNLIFYIIICVVIIGLLAPIASSLLLVFYCYIIKEKNTSLIVGCISIAISFYYVIDFYNYWLLSVIVSWFWSTWIKELVYLNTALIFVNIVCLFRSEYIYNVVQKNRVYLFLTLSGVTVLLYFSCMLAMKNSVSSTINQKAVEQKVSTNQ